MLGPGNEDAAKEALATWPQALQVGGGITDANAAEWIEYGADKVGLPRKYGQSWTRSGQLPSTLQI